MSGADETLKHRRGKKIAAKGIYRDLAGFSHTHFVKTSIALRWVCVTLLVRIPWASRVAWGLALPEHAGSLRALRQRARQTPQ